MSNLSTQSLHAYLKQRYGLGNALVTKLCAVVNLSPRKRAAVLSEAQEHQITLYLRRIKMLVGFPLQQKRWSKHIYDQQIGNTRSYKLRALLPLNGQRTANAVTAKRFAQILLRQMRIHKP